jgi:hypothetical protein
VSALGTDVTEIGMIHRAVSEGHAQAESRLVR